jgi:hypothetical protein
MGKLLKVGPRYHHFITKTAETGSNFNFFGENIAGVDLASDM